MTKEEKIRRFGEVFTPPEIVEKMLDMLEEESPDCFAPGTTYLEPTCGEGVFVCGILRRKFENCTTDAERRIAIRSVWAMELQADNVEKTIRAVTELCEQNLKLRKEDREIIRSHIIQADALKVMGMMNELNQMEGGGPVFFALSPRELALVEMLDRMEEKTMEIKKPEWWRKRDHEGVDGSVRLALRLEAVLPEPGAIMDGEKWLAEVERQLREGLEQAIRNLREKGWP